MKHCGGGRRWIGLMEPKRLALDCSRAEATNSDSIRHNCLGIPMLSSYFHHLIFDEANRRPPQPPGDMDLKRVLHKLRTHDLLKDNKGDSSSKLMSADFVMPPLIGAAGIEGHFERLGNDLSHPHQQSLSDMSQLDNIDPLPTQWSTNDGWTLYDADRDESIPSPPESAMVFDVEILVREEAETSNSALLAVSLGLSGRWYSWCSKRLSQAVAGIYDQIVEEELIPFDKHRDQILVGHNVAFDRSYITNEYSLKSSNLRFMDTMSLHISVAGLTSLQQMIHAATAKGSSTSPSLAKLIDEHDSLQWLSHSSAKNSLAAVYAFNFPNEAALDKDPRDLLIQGTLRDIVEENVQKTFAYCASDVLATFRVFHNLWPAFKQRIPHSISTSSLLTLGSPILPTTKTTWNGYLSSANRVFRYEEGMQKLELMQLAFDALKFGRNDAYLSDPWLSQLDWSTREAKLKKLKTSDAKRLSGDSDVVGKLLALGRIALPAMMEKRRGFLYGFPAWFNDLIDSDSVDSVSAAALNNFEFSRLSPWLLSTRKRSCPLLMKLQWKGNPVVYDEKIKWSYSSDNESEEKNERRAKPVDVDPQQVEDVGEVWRQQMSAFHSRSSAQLKLLARKSENGGVMSVANVQTFKSVRPLPHAKGDRFFVGNPLSRDFLHHIEQGRLTSLSGLERSFIKTSRRTAYWNTNRARIESQILRRSGCGSESRILLPRVIPMGTVTRRTVEKTWLTAANVDENMVGSELKQMIHAPPGYCFVGADVDSQELWIASLLADSGEGFHGSSPIGWMTLQGEKALGTDVHSCTAATIGTSRHNAKILNYSRMYGAGLSLTTQLLMTFEDGGVGDDAKERAMKLMEKTKGSQVMGVKGREWRGGTESDMFNTLERIASLDQPRTPFLNACMTQSLQPSHVAGNFLPSRINWIVQSSAVDFLHLLLGEIEYLFRYFKVNGRLALSIHDELRYMVSWSDRYRASLAFHIANMKVRCFFSSRLGIHDLPNSIAFFSSVEIDWCLRKDVTDECFSPSNKLGMFGSFGLPHGVSMNINELLDLMRDDEESGNGEAWKRRLIID